MSNLPEKLDHCLLQLAQASSFAKARHRGHILDVGARLLQQEDGHECLYERVLDLEQAGLFVNTDWQSPHNLLAQLVPQTLNYADKQTVVLDCISQLRMLAYATGRSNSDAISQQQARDFLAKVLSLNLNFVLGHSDENLRNRLGGLVPAIGRLYRFILSKLGYETILSQLVDEVWNVLAQRPIQVQQAKTMVTQISIVIAQNDLSLGDAKLGTDRLVSALFGPTTGCMDDPGLEAYCARLEGMDRNALLQEASGFARAMHDVGLVSDYHACFLRWALKQDQGDIVPTALGLSNTGVDVLITYKQLVHSLIEHAIYPETAQSLLGLSMMLENGILFDAPVAPSLWRQLQMDLHPDVEAVLVQAFGSAVPAKTQLLAGVISLLGQPLGISQGNNPTCQSARAISLWALNDPDFLLNAIIQVVCKNNLCFNFEGLAINSASLLNGMTETPPLDTDPVSVVLVPHLDKLYMEMGRLCSDRGEDPHKWINPEFHGWYVGRKFMIAVDVLSGNLKDHQTFLEEFYSSYHPLYNGNIPVIHPQPAGIAITDSMGTFVGWHAVTIIRVALDQDHVMRVYFFNPNSDSTQNWGQGVMVSTSGKGERYGEASLPFDQFASRLYIYHDDNLSIGGEFALPMAEIQSVMAMAEQSWAEKRLAPDHAPMELENNGAPGESRTLSQTVL